MGIFPWYEEGGPIMWHAPRWRCVLYPTDFKLRKSLKQAIRNGGFKICFDSDFEDVIAACATIRRKGQDGTWITEEMKEAYIKLFELGHAHCLSCYRDDELVGGLYGVQVGNVFCGESMFSHISNASKVCMAALIASFDWTFVDCQVYNDHLGSLGAVEIEREEFINTLAKQSLEREEWTNKAVNFGF